jgi:hypothetical protein
MVGASMRLGQWLLDLSPFTHIPKAPGAAVSATPLVWLLAVAGAGRGRAGRAAPPRHPHHLTDHAAGAPPLPSTLSTSSVWSLDGIGAGAR